MGVNEKAGAHRDVRDIAILLPHLHVGGAERVSINLANQFARRGFAVDIVLMRGEGELISQLDARVRVVDLGAPQVRSALFPLIRYLRRALPAGVIANMWPLTVIAPLAARLALFRGRVAISEHEPLSRGYGSRGRSHRAMLRGSMLLAYPLADARIAVSSGVAGDMASLSGLPRRIFDVIYNPAALDQSLDHPLPRPAELGGIAGPLILTVGTLKKVKRHELLIEAFARMPSDPSAMLCILGDGPERAALERQIATRGLSGRVLLPGYAADTAPWYAAADLFVLSSDYEGFGNVIVEGLEQGTPIVSTDCPFGPSEILEGGKYGTLVPVGDVAALAKAMHDALSREHDHVALKHRAQDFSVDKAADAYLDLLLPGWRAKTQTGSRLQ